MATVIKLLVYGICVIGLLMGPYILFLAYRQTTTSFRNPQLAKKQGLIAIGIGILALAAILIFKL